ncbi:MAG: hypothetical protein HY269_07505 [Deltaproteobacteria bacterium]|nr:hypothetical protein [Deltaproteobacteria bacterium]
MTPAVVPRALKAGLVGLSAFDGVAARDAVQADGVEAVEIHRPALAQSGYVELVSELLAAPRFMCDFSQNPSERALPQLCLRLLGHSGHPGQLERLLSDLVAVERFARQLGGERVLVSIRNWFAPGDLVWHVDRSSRAAAFRVLWPLGRSEGMRVTPFDNIEPVLYAAFMRREHPILCRLDREIASTSKPLEVLWRHRPAQVDAMIAGNYPYMRDPALVAAMHPDAISVHRIATPRMRGTFHRSAWANRHTPGLQIIVTSTSL